MSTIKKLEQNPWKCMLLTLKNIFSFETHLSLSPHEKMRSYFKNFLSECEQIQNLY